MSKTFTIVLVAGAATIGVFVAVRAWLGRFEADLKEHKSARTTTGVVVDKKYVQFASDQKSYQDAEGHSFAVENWLRKEGQYRILYTIDNFNQIPDDHRQNLMSAEQERSNRYGTRFTIVDKHSFDVAKIGTPVVVSYRWASDSKIEIILVELETAAAKSKEEL